MHRLSSALGKDRARAEPTQGCWLSRPQALLPRSAPPSLPQGGGSGAMSRQSLTLVPSPSPACFPPEQGRRGGRPARAGGGCWQGRPAAGWAPRAGRQAHSSHLAAQGPLQPPLQEASLPRPASPLPSPVLPGNPLPLPQLGLLAQSPWEPDSSGLGTDSPSLAFSLPLALGREGEDFSSRVATLESQCPAPLAWPRVGSPIYPVIASLEPVSRGRDGPSLPSGGAGRERLAVSQA